MNLDQSYYPNKLWNQVTETTLQPGEKLIIKQVTKGDDIPFLVEGGEAYHQGYDLVITNPKNEEILVKFFEGKVSDPKIIKVEPFGMDYF